MTPQVQLRQHCRQRRNALSPERQQIHAQQATRLLLRSPLLMRSRKIALFLPTDGELDTLPLIQTLWQRKVKVYLPLLTRFRRRPMLFAPFTADTPLLENYFGILEPQVPKHQLISGQHLNSVVMPLACFDALGNRIGMGGGFYDKTFQFKRLRNASTPKLIGWAHQCQKIDTIQTQPWDIPLDALVTENSCQIFRQNKP